VAPFALLAELAVNRLDKRQFGAANPPRHGCVHFSSPLGVNKQKEPPRAAAPIGVAHILGFSCRVPIQAGTNGQSDLAGGEKVSTVKSRMPLGGKYSRIFRRHADSGVRLFGYPNSPTQGLRIRTALLTVASRSLFL
jgi:hypothetical protein